MGWPFGYFPFIRWKNILPANLPLSSTPRAVYKRIPDSFLPLTFYFSSSFYSYFSRTLSYFADEETGGRVSSVLFQPLSLHCRDRSSMLAHAPAYSGFSTGQANLVSGCLSVLGGSLGFHHSPAKQSELTVPAIYGSGLFTRHLTSSP